jgi:hypothetical protein
MFRRGRARLSTMLNERTSAWTRGAGAGGEREKRTRCTKRGHEDTLTRCTRRAGASSQLVQAPLDIAYQNCTLYSAGTSTAGGTGTLACAQPLTRLERRSPPRAVHRARIGPRPGRGEEEGQGGGGLCKQAAGDGDTSEDGTRARTAAQARTARARTARARLLRYLDSPQA